MNNTFLHSLIELADGFSQGSLLEFAFTEFSAHITNSGAGSASKNSVLQTSFFVLTIAFNL